MTTTIIDAFLLLPSIIFFPYDDEESSGLTNFTFQAYLSLNETDGDIITSRKAYGPALLGMTAKFLDGYTIPQAAYENTMNELCTNCTVLSTLLTGL